MSPVTRRVRARAGLASSRRRLKDESDEEELPSIKVARNPAIQPLTQEAKERNARQALLDDLGSKRRDEVTRADIGHPQSCKLSTIFKNRDCNQPDTEAANLAVQNRKEIVSWSSFGSTDVANDGTYEVLPDIAMGQYHRVAVAERLREEGIVHLGHSYGIRRGGGAIDRGGRPGQMSSNASYRPLDPAVIDGEKDSRYANGGLSSKSRSKSKANIRMENTIGRTIPVATRGDRTVATGRGGGRTFQHRPWPPAALGHLGPKLADPSDFMAAFASQQLQAKRPEVGKSAAVQPASGKIASMIPIDPAAIVKCTSTVSEVDASIKQVSREELRAPIFSPSNLTEGKPSPEILQSPSVESEQEVGAVNVNLLGLGTSGVDVGAPIIETSNVGQVPTTVEIETAILQKFIIDEDITGLVGFLEPLLKVEHEDRLISKLTQTTPSLTASKLASLVEDAADTPGLRTNSFRATEPVVADAKVLPETSAPNPASNRAPSSTKSKGLSESKWATAASASLPTPLLPKSTNDTLTKSDSSAIFGDLKKVARLPKGEGDMCFKATRAEVLSQKATTMKRIRPGPGFQALVKEAESMKVKQVVPLEVNAALNTASLLGAQYSSYRVENDGNESEESEL